MAKYGNLTRKKHRNKYEHHDHHGKVIDFIMEQIKATYIWDPDPDAVVPILRRPPMHLATDEREPKHLQLQSEGCWIH